MNEVMTARGPIAADQLGVTLMHEHIFINEMLEERPIGLLHDYELMTQEVDYFTAAGGGTIVELSTAELTSGASPDPTGRFSGVPSTGYAENGSREPNQVLNLVRLSEQTGVHLVLGAGHYRDPYLDRTHIDRRSVDQIAETIINEVTEGFAGTGVRAGIIGEIACDRWHVSAAEERSFRAAARAQRATGLAVTTHASRWPVGIEQLDILTDEGADPRRVIIGHSDTVNIPEYHEAIAARGAFVEFDTIRGNPEFDLQRRVTLVMNLVRKGFLDRILLSHDVCTRPHLHYTGGEGYDYVPTHFARILVDAGLDAAEVEQLLVHNPRRALTGE
jgi:phosphotriesterase-related protein